MAEIDRSMMKVAGATVTLVGGGLAVVVPQAQAATFTASTEGELRTAIYNANTTGGADTITIAAGTINLTSDLPDITEALTITGAGQGTTILDGGDNYGAFYATSAVELLTISAMTIQNMYRNQSGGPAINAQGSLTVSSVTFHSNSIYTGDYLSNDGYAEGGAIYVHGTSPGDDVLITDSIFTNNGTRGYYNGEGGAVMVDFPYGTGPLAGPTAYSDLTITDTTFDGNYSNDDGGALLFELAGGTVTITDSTFTNNAADSDGGAIATDDNSGTIDISGTTFSYNSAGDEGGAIYLDDGDLEVTVTNSTFDRNAADKGGAVAIDGAELTVVGSTFSYNEAWDGGAIYADGSDTDGISVTDSTFNGNTAYKPNYGYASQGGAIRTERPLSVTDSTFTDNFAGDDGGAIFIDAVLYVAPASGVPIALTVTGSTFTGNESDNDGGAIAMYDTNADIATSTFSYNAADEDGGAVSMYHGGSLSIADSTFNDNLSYDDGGAIHAERDKSGAVAVSGSVFTDNRAYEETYARGGAIASFVPLTVTESSFTGNSAGDDGGAIFVYASVYVTAPNTADVPTAFSIANSTLSGNLAVDDGGAIFAYQTVSEIRQSTIYGNTAYEYGGAIVAYSTDMAISNSTIVGNRAQTVGGIWGYNSDLYIDNTILWDNTDDSDGAQIQDENSLTGANNITDVDPMLNPLANNGGPTLTMLPKVGSPAFDAGNNAIKPFDTDQRGAERVYKDVIDIGAVEAQADERSEVLPPTGSGAERAAWLAAMLTGLGAAFTAATRRRGARQR